LAVNKPSGLPTLPGGGFMENTLLRLVQKDTPNANPVHRLGRATTGIVLFAKTPQATLRMRGVDAPGPGIPGPGGWKLSSEKYRLPTLSVVNAALNVSWIWALVAGPPSPEKPKVPFPATVVTVPSGEILLIRLLLGSGTYKLFLLSTATPHTWPDDTLVLPRSTLVMIPELEILRIRPLP
jgi:hypothetical protein